MKTNHKILKG